MNLSVDWPDGRSVIVAIRVRQPPPHREWADKITPSPDEGEADFYIGPLELESRESLVAFLRRKTLGKANGDRLEAVVWSPGDETILELLDVTAPTALIHVSVDG